MLRDLYVRGKYRDVVVKHAAMDNHSMGTVFEAMVRNFNEENNEEPA